MEKIVIASDHAGRELKDDLKTYLVELGFEVQDFGTDSDASVDYPDYARKVAEAVTAGSVARGVLVCGSGIGMSIMANRFRGVRAALVSDLYTARLCKEHNNANVLVMGGRVVGKGLAREMLKAWIEAKFAGGRHQGRLDKIDAGND